MRDPGRDRIEQDRLPVVKLPGADRDAVAAGVVHERDAEQLQARHRVDEPGLAQGPEPERRHPADRRGEVAQVRQLNLGDVLAPTEVGGVRAGPDVHDRVISDPPQCTNCSTTRGEAIEGLAVAAHRWCRRPTR